MTTRPEGLTCQELVELVTDYLEGALAPAERTRFEEHLDLCEGCTTHLEQIRQTIGLTGALRHDDLDPTVRRKLHMALRDWKQGGPPLS